MAKSKDLLKQKAKISSSLSESLEEHPDELTLQIKTEVTPDGRKVLVFQDPLYSREKKSVVNYTIFKGKWEFENLDNLDDTDKEKCAVNFVPVRDSSNITIVFKSLKDRLEFMNSIYSDNDMKQTGGGMSLEKIANTNVLKTTGGLIGLSIAGYGLYKMFSKKKNGS